MPKRYYEKDGNISPLKGKKKKPGAAAGGGFGTVTRGEPGAVVGGLVGNSIAGLVSNSIDGKETKAQAGFRIHLFGIRGLVTAIDHAHLFFGLAAGDARFEPAEQRQKSGPAFDNVGRQSFLLEDAGQPDLALRKRKLECRGQDADHYERCAVERDRLAENTLIAPETFLPKGIAQQRHVRAAGPIFIGIENAAKERLHAEGSEKILRYPDAVEIFRFTATGQGESSIRLGGKLGKTLLSVAPGGVTRPGNIRAIETAFRERTPDAHELFRLRIGKRTEEQGVDRGEQHRVRADPEGERDDRENSEPRLAQELSESVTKVVHEFLIICCRAFIRCARLRSGSPDWRGARG